jgi:RNA polymerase-interacting CarD/CdnL/TRCF family regulator
VNRAEHLAWAKQRALEYVDDGDLQSAYASLASDLTKHRDTRTDPVLQRRVQAGMERLVDGELRTPEEMRRYIEAYE